ATNAFDSNYNGDTSIYNFYGDVFVTKLAADGSQLVYSTLLGGSNGDLGEALTLDSLNQVILTGMTFSSDYPTTIEPIDIKPSMGAIIVSKMSPDGSQLLYSNYLGGSRLENGAAIHIDSTDNIYVLGITDSFDFPTTSNAYSQNYKSVLYGSKDLVIAKLGLLSPGLTTIISISSHTSSFSDSEMDFMSSEILVLVIVLMVFYGSWRKKKV
ncbi:MAG: hypothetical protein ACXAC7_02055, partial [Candidatus Hodarchaeales archaeon]